MADTGNTAAIAFGTTTGFTPAVLSIELPEETREALEDTDLATTGQKTYVPDDLREPGESPVTIYWDQSASTFPPISTAAETITVTFPLKAGEGTAATFAGTGFLIRSKGPVVQNGELMQADFTIKWDGKTDTAYTAGSV